MRQTGSKATGQINSRVRRINAFRRWRVLLLLLPAGVLAQDPAGESPLAAAAIDETGFTGTILIHDLRGGSFVAGHSERIDQPLLPASTFKIFSSLVALETGVIDGPDSIIRWDGVTRSREVLNQDLPLRQAFRVSAVPHYQDLVRRIGHERMQQFIDRAGYGNRDISGGIELFWLSGGLRITPREQVAFLARLYRNELPFSHATMEAVREMMVTDDGNGYTIRAKTGWAAPPNEGNTGWWTGWVERGDSVYVFATVLEADDAGDSFGPAREAVTRQVLAALGIL
ncbi:MAG: penicillin-binding transpeptidase domain-containing protein [Woeseia sp.]